MRVVYSLEGKEDKNTEIKIQKTNKNLKCTGSILGCKRKSRNVHFGRFWRKSWRWKFILMGHYCLECSHVIYCKSQGIRWIRCSDKRRNCSLTACCVKSVQSAKSLNGRTAGASSANVDTNLMRPVDEFLVSRHVASRTKRKREERRQASALFALYVRNSSFLPFISGDTRKRYCEH